MAYVVVRVDPNNGVLSKLDGTWLRSDENYQHPQFESPDAAEAFIADRRRELPYSEWWIREAGTDRAVKGFLAP